jgi:hypothetical protein
MTHPEKAPRIALISATRSAIAPAVEAFHARFPEAEVWNVLDDKLLADLETAGNMTPELEQRMHRLIRYAAAEADGVLLTCSQYGPVAGGAGVAVPVLAPDEAAFAEVVNGGFTTVLVLASIDSSLDDTLMRLQAEATRAGSPVRFVGVVSREARAAADRDDRAALAEAIVGAVRADATRLDAVFLAQYSLSPAADAIADALGVPVITGPDTAAARLRRELGPDS